MTSANRPSTAALRPDALAATALLITLAACGDPAPPATTPDRQGLYTTSGDAFGTTYTVRSTRPVDPATVDARLDQIDRAMSTYRDDSEIARFNASTTTTWFPVPEDLVATVQAARHVSEATGGALDITAAPLIDLWNPQTTSTPPPALAVANARLLVNFHNLNTRTEPPALLKTNLDTRIDVSAVAKGFAVDAVADLLDARGHTAYLVEIGGELRSRGLKPDGSPFTVGIEQPSPGRRSLHSTLPLTGAAMATSGDYRNFFTHDGHHYSHLIDPRTGRPVTHHLASVTVVVPDTASPHPTATADATATALLVLGPDQGYTHATDHHIAALFIERHPDGSTTTRTTPAFEERPHHTTPQ